MALTQRQRDAGKAMTASRVVNVDEETRDRPRPWERFQHVDPEHGLFAVPFASLDAFELVPFPTSPTSNRQARVGTGSGGEL